VGLQDGSERQKRSARVEVNREKQRTGIIDRDIGCSLSSLGVRGAFARASAETSVG
jgi:hypothetical protein